MNIVLCGLCEPLLVVGGLGGPGIAVPFVSYVDPTAVSVVG